MTPHWESAGVTLPVALIFSSPGLLDDIIGPDQATHVARAVVEAGERDEGA